MLCNSVILHFLLANKRKGLFGENIAKEDYKENGFEIISTRIGCDFIAWRRVGEKIYQEYVEVKTGKSRQSVTQKRKMREMRRHGINYTVYRITDAFLSNYISAENTKMENTYFAANNKTEIGKMGTLANETIGNAQKCLYTTDKVRY
jgi:hypothetical protein